MCVCNLFFAFFLFSFFLFLDAALLLYNLSILTSRFYIVAYAFSFFLSPVSIFILFPFYSLPKIRTQFDLCSHCILLIYRWYFIFSIYIFLNAINALTQFHVNVTVDMSVIPTITSASYLREQSRILRWNTSNLKHKWQTTPKYLYKNTTHYITQS